MERVEIRVKGMTCDHCVMSVTKALKGIKGVRAADVNLAMESAKVTYDPSEASLADLHHAVVEAGYQVEA